MKDENYNPEDLENEDEDEFEDYPYFHEELCDALTPTIKQFLLDHFGERLFNLAPETYLEIDKTIKEGFIYADDIPDIFYRHKTITDEAKFEEALANFVRPTSKIEWPIEENWFDRDFSDDDDDEDTFLEDSDPMDLTEDQRKAKQLIEHIDQMTFDMQNFAYFIKTGYCVTMDAAHNYLEKHTPFDLSILSPEGFEQLQSNLSFLIEVLMEDLDGLINGELNAEAE